MYRLVRVAQENPEALKKAEEIFTNKFKKVEVFKDQLSKILKEGRSAKDDGWTLFTTGLKDVEPVRLCNLELDTTFKIFFTSEDDQEKCEKDLEIFLQAKPSKLYTNLGHGAKTITCAHKLNPQIAEGVLGLLHNLVRLHITIEFPYQTEESRWFPSFKPIVKKLGINTGNF